MLMTIKKNTTAFQTRAACQLLLRRYSHMKNEERKIKEEINPIFEVKRRSRKAFKPASYETLLSEQSRRLLPSLSSVIFSDKFLSSVGSGH
ncbi:hypothetical protein CEXT_517861 [Caerostris extrusa]|uniref:Uncharacterized protein n=1 Tax=Caerostris extrusa TaxID=172846 RepID=A0AAV4SLP0_CAEEX|nr:hypothetical protein CEXT_517861 [Caerostris extrusa]